MAGDSAPEDASIDHCEFLRAGLGELVEVGQVRVVAARGHAIDDRRPSPGLIHHSDRGSPYGSDDYIAALDEHDVIRSMSRKGDCWDNAVAESFFASLQHECRRLHSFRSSADARRVVESYIDHFYNPERLHSTLEYLSPIEFELRSVLDQQAA